MRTLDVDTIELPAFIASRAAALTWSVRVANRAYPVTEEEIVGRERTKVVAEARAFVCKLLRRCGLGYSEIGRLLGRDHSTIMAYCQGGFCVVEGRRVRRK